ncbi:MAG: hypothetical protein A3G41_07015 [Elusimicrobia bacterium RIFCSPLOWO2_12_FULL_59_9]|nr:MAG: hypothetical protein A3G41_07015 [Elusimicrobia bacterium RIFCSPLOWO2_12_FULL_59_9]
MERSYSTDTRIAQTRVALEANEGLARDRARVDAYLGHLGGKDMFQPIYGMGRFPHGLPLALPPYLIHILDASARVLLAFTRQEVREHGPQYLIDRAPKGWLAPETAERLHAHYLATEPDLAFDVLIQGVSSRRGTSFEELKKAGDMLQAKVLEAQSVDTYYGWYREYLAGSRRVGLGSHCRFRLEAGAGGMPLSDLDLDAQVLSGLQHPQQNDPGSIFFLEIDPEKQPSGQNLVFMAQAMGGGDMARRPLILDPRDLELRGDRLYCRRPGQERELKKAISRLVDVDLQSYIKAREKAGEQEVIDGLRRIFSMPQLWGDLNKHLMGFYLINKETITALSQKTRMNVLVPSRMITAEDVQKMRRDPARLKSVAIKPLLGMSAKGVEIGPTLEQFEQAVAHEPTLMQDLFWATPLMPDILGDIEDPDVQAGLCSETRLLMHGGSPSVRHNSQRARTIGVLSRTHFQSADHRRRIKNDRAGRGWYSNMGAILGVKAELGLGERNDAGVGMAPVYWID